MYEKLDRIIKESEYEDINTLNRWGNVDFKKAFNYVEQFTDNDWEMLFNDLPNKSTIWKKRFVVCLTEANNNKQLKALLSMVNTEDQELFSTIICHLIKHDITGYEGLNEIKDRVYNLLPQVNDYYKYMFNIFLEGQGKEINDEMHKLMEEQTNNKKQDSNYLEIKELSIKGYNYALRVIENNELISQEEAKKNIDLMVSKLDDVNDVNRQEASNLVSEGILDYNYASGNKDIASLRIGHILRCIPKAKN